LIRTAPARSSCFYGLYVSIILIYPLFAIHPNDSVQVERRCKWIPIRTTTPLCFQFANWPWVSRTFLQRPVREREIALWSWKERAGEQMVWGAPNNKENEIIKKNITHTTCCSALAGN